MPYCLQGRRYPVYFQLTKKLTYRLYGEKGRIMKKFFKWLLSGKLEANEYSNRANLMLELI